MKSTFPYLEIEWQHQKERIKKIFGHNDAYTPEQYVNSLLVIVEKIASKSPNNRYAAALEVWEEWRKQAPPENTEAADLKGWLQRMIRDQRLNSAKPNHA